MLSRSIMYIGILPIDDLRCQWLACRGALPQRFPELRSIAFALLEGVGVLADFRGRAQLRDVAQRVGIAVALNLLLLESLLQVLVGLLRTTADLRDGDERSAAILQRHGIVYGAVVGFRRVESRRENFRGNGRIPAGDEFRRLDGDLEILRDLIEGRSGLQLGTCGLGCGECSVSLTLLLHCGAYAVSNFGESFHVR